MSLNAAATDTKAPAVNSRLVELLGTLKSTSNILFQAEDRLKGSTPTEDSKEAIEPTTTLALLDQIEAVAHGNSDLAVRIRDAL
ncbi:MAG: hypothetical protein ACW99J_15160 [Candidatus Thorarchaeota archaeon]|jgi:hypothetical protein